MEAPQQDGGTIASHILEWQDVRYNVVLRDKTKLEVLHGISGKAVSGRLFALMGPSGAGKTSLLDILAGVPVVGKAAGRVQLDHCYIGPEAAAPQSGGRAALGRLTSAWRRGGGGGDDDMAPVAETGGHSASGAHVAHAPSMGGGNGQHQLSASAARKRSRTCYVQQRDVLMPSATVREVLMTSALLLLPHSLSRREKEARVDGLITQLGLTKCANSLVGDETFGIKGISGGEKRRLSVGVELIKQPLIIFLDEPTTGLDSEMALGVMRVLQVLAHEQGMMVIATIHQPNSDIVDTFDDLMLLAAGYVAYSGTWKEAVPYFNARGFSCPMYKNPTDYFMSLACDGQLVPKLAALHAEAATAAAEAPAGDVEAGRAGMGPTPHLSMGIPGVGGSGGGVLALAAKPAAKPGMWYQIWVLMARFARSWWRTPIMIVAELSQYVLLGLFVGLLYLNQGNVVPDAVQDRLSSIFLALTLLMFTPSYTAVVVWDMERKLLLREAGSGAYKRGSFFLAKTFTTGPVEIVQVVVFATVVFFMVNFQRTVAKFFIWLAVCILFTLIAETSGYLCAIATSDSKMGIVLLTLVMVVLLSFSGYLVRQVPIYFQWISRISFFSYASDALAQNEFEGLTLYTPGGVPVPGEPLLPASMATGLSLGGNVAVLAGMLVGTRLLAWGGLELAAALKWL